MVTSSGDSSLHFCHACQTEDLHLRIAESQGSLQLQPEPDWHFHRGLNSNATDPRWTEAPALHCKARGFVEA
jgi:hypothetical protein